MREGIKAVARVNPGEFLRQVRAESAKIVWPTRRETLMTGMMVVIMTSLLAFFFFGVDSAFSAIVQALLGLLS
jgi:preprotein translocase subunit SecE